MLGGHGSRIAWTGIIKLNRMIKDKARAYDLSPCLFYGNNFLNYDETFFIVYGAVSEGL